MLSNTKCTFLYITGVQRTKLNKLGLHTSDMGQIFLDDVRVPVKNIIGEEGKGFTHQMVGVMTCALLCFFVFNSGNTSLSIPGKWFSKMMSGLGT